MNVRFLKQFLVNLAVSFLIALFVGLIIGPDFFTHPRSFWPVWVIMGAVIFLFAIIFTHAEEPLQRHKRKGKQS